MPMPSYQMALIVIVAIIGAVPIVYTILILRHRARMAQAYPGRNEAYEKLAREAVEAQRKAAEDRAKTIECLTELRDRIAAIEKLLREVS